ncbi:MAG: NAD(P)-binding protein [Planctomycetes bacterium]|nr:NAD(P)-binding protein [Planctomycetota bacterium]
MIELTIDNLAVSVDDGATILDAAEQAGVSIPSMCFLKGCAPSTSCMVCVVRVNGRESLAPACGTKAVDGMVVESDCDEVHAARKTALELLLSDHVGDCMGPCHVTCPAKMDIPLMIRQIAGGEFGEAIKTIKNDIPLPAVLGRICPAPCENACRRRLQDSAVSICLLKRFVADVDLASPAPYMPVQAKKKNKRVAIVGAGCVGLSAAYYLQVDGFDCTVFDSNEKGGGMLCDEPADKLSGGVLAAEVGVIEKMGVEFKLNMQVTGGAVFDKICKEFDAVLLAVGLENSEGLDSSLPSVFVGSDIGGKKKMAVAAVAAGKAAAVCVGQYLGGEDVAGSVKPFNSRMGKLLDGEIDVFMESASKAGRVEPAGYVGGFVNDEAVGESLRCLHCDCRKPVDCKLRRYAEEYSAKANTYKAKRRGFAQVLESEVVFEQGKCIDCGLCVEIASRESAGCGLAFTGRGFDVKVAVPFGRSLTEGLGRVAAKCIAACPVGALTSR